MDVRAARSHLIKAIVMLVVLSGCAAQNGAGSDSAGSDSAGSDSAGSDSAGSDSAGSDSAGSVQVGSASAGGSVSPGSAKTSPTAFAGACAHIYRGAVVAHLSPADSLVQVRVCVADPSTGDVSDKAFSAAESQETLDWLAGLLAQPSASRDESLICTAELRSVPDFVVTTQSGQVLAPIVPTDPCGKPSLEVVKLLEQIGTP